MKQAPAIPNSGNNTKNAASSSRRLASASNLRLKGRVALFSKLFRAGPRKAFEIPPDTRAYAIGDVHGRYDLLVTLLGRIEADSRERPCAREYIVFLGDLIDRGPDSRGVLDYLLRARQFMPNPIFLAGNHEEMLLRVLRHDADQIVNWLNFGGHECVESYGLDASLLATMSPERAQEKIRGAIPQEHIDFIAGFADSFRLGDYLFVHAGIRPGVPLEDQTVQDLHWIREDFLSSPARFPYMVVHGHTISATPDERNNRIGIDTGAYNSGKLTALCIEGTERKFIEARA
ncbi:MAG: metallophosphoesterase family protein [Sphingomonas sp.]